MAQRFARFGGKPFLTRLFGVRTVNVYEYKHVCKVLALEHDAVEGESGDSGRWAVRAVRG